MQNATRVVMPKPYEVITETYKIGSPGQGQVLIATEASAISAGTELAVYTGIHQWLNDPTRTWPRFPFVPGYAGVGRIAAVGAGVDGLAEGDRVVWDARHESHALVNVTSDRSLLRPIAEHVPAPVAALVPLARFPFAALVQSDRMLGQAVGLAVVPGASAPAPSDLRRFLLDRLPPSHNPLRILVVAAIPATPRGKRSRSSLAAHFGLGERRAP